jgi:hypothetical protein
MVAREPGESDADYELRQRDHRHNKSRCVVSSSSEEEEEEEEEKESWFSRRLGTGSGWFSHPSRDSRGKEGERRRKGKAGCSRA